MERKTLISAFVEQIIAKTDFSQLDQIYLYNRILNLVDGVDKTGDYTDKSLIELADLLVNLGDTERTAGQKELLKTELLNFLVPAPSKFNQIFWNKYQQQGVNSALKYLYQLNQASNYIKTAEISKNKYFRYQSKYGELEITINLSKPEKDPRDIARLQKLAPTSYPQCQLCFTNEGYQGRIGYPARSNHRIIRFDLLNETWGLQYSPYAYFNEHCIFVDQKHQLMKIDRLTFRRLLTILDIFPAYFVGSNADLPIVGGSILSHEHFQGGRHEFAMDQAKIRQTITFTDFAHVKAGIVDWPMSVIRLSGKNKEELVELATKILNSWKNYSDEKVAVIAASDHQPHHTITPIARKRGAEYELDLVLRDNHCTKEFPAGVFHPHPDVQNIKQENIGLIEVMGLAILPPRLQRELAEVEKYLLHQPNQIAEKHLHWTEKILQQYDGKITAENVTSIVKQALGATFVRVLEDAGVFKNDSVGQNAFNRFVDYVNE
ncbi:MAG: UDP-glucose--hexose-1-phosphate uridylyltransferase [Liquorilactobacillus nagelii]